MNQPLAKHRTARPPKCEVYESPTRITCREDDPDKGPTSELQTFTCINCSHTQQVSVETPGALSAQRRSGEQHE
jgi:hypothetical protein